MNVRDSAVQQVKLLQLKNLYIDFFYLSCLHENKNKGIWLIVFILTTFKIHWDLWHWEWDLWYKLDWELGFGQNLG